MSYINPDNQNFLQLFDQKIQEIDPTLKNVDVQFDVKQGFLITKGSSPSEKTVTHFSEAMQALLKTVQEQVEKTKVSEELLKVDGALRVCNKVTKIINGLLTGLQTASKLSEDSKKQLEKLEGEFSKTGKATESIAKKILKISDGKFIFGANLLHSVIMSKDSNKKEIVERLIKSGVNINERNAEGETPLIMACRMKLPEIAMMLIENNADLSIQDKYRQTALHWACSDHVNAEVSLKLIEKKVDLNVEEAYGIRPLVSVVFGICFLAEGKDKFKKILDVMGKNGANLDLALLSASKISPFPVIKMLIEKGANPWVKDKQNQTPFMFCVKRGQYDEAFVKLCLSKTTEHINAQDLTGKTALHYAFQYGDKGLIDLLLKNNASLLVKDNNGFTPLWQGQSHKDYNALPKLWNATFQSLGFDQICPPLGVVNFNVDSTIPIPPFYGIQSDSASLWRFVENASKQQNPLEIALLFNSNFLKGEMKRILGDLQYPQLVIQLAEKYKDQKELVSQFFRYELDPTHYARGTHILKKEYPQAKSSTKIDTLETLFTKINFTDDKQKATYIDPKILTKIDGGGALTPEQLKKGLLDFIKNIKGRAKITGAPTDEKEREAFYKKLENIACLIVEKLQEDKDAAATATSVQLLELGAAGHHCATRYQNALTQVYDTLTGTTQIQDIEEGTYSFLTSARLGVMEELSTKIKWAGMQPHTFKALMALFKDTYGTTKSEFTDILADDEERRLRNGKNISFLREYIERFCSPQAFIKNIHDLFASNHDLKDTFKSWCKEHMPKVQEKEKEKEKGKTEKTTDEYEDLLEKMENLSLEPFKYDTAEIPEELTKKLEAIGIYKQAYPATFESILNRAKEDYKAKMQATIVELLKKAEDENVSRNRIDSADMRAAFDLFKKKQETTKTLAPILRQQVAKEVAQNICKEAFKEVDKKVSDYQKDESLGYHPLQESLQEFVKKKLKPFFSTLNVPYKNLDWTVDEKATSINLGSYVLESTPFTWEQVVDSVQRHEYVMGITDKELDSYITMFLEKLGVIQKAGKKVELGKDATVTKETIQAIAKFAPHVESLTIKSDSRVSADVYAELRNLSRLKDLRVACDFDNKCAEMLAKNCTALEALDLRSTDVTAKGIALIVKKCTKLQKLGLGYTKADDTTVQAIIENCKEIRELDLNHAWVRKVDALAIAKNCSQLQVLHLGSNNDIDDVTVEAIADNCKELRELYLSRNESITDKSIISLMEKCPKLDRLDLYGTKISKECAAKIKSRGLKYFVTPSGF